MVKRLSTMRETWVQSLGWQDLLEKEMATHSSTLAWKILWTEEPGRLQSMGLQRVGHDWAISLSLFTFMHWRRKWQPTPVFLPGESQGRGAWWAAVSGVTQSRTRLKWLSSIYINYKDIYILLFGFCFLHLLKPYFINVISWLLIQFFWLSVLQIQWITKI